MAGHYGDIIMSAMASRITGISSVCSTVCSGANQENIKRKHQSFASLVLVRGIHRWREFPAQRASNAEIVSICWHHHGQDLHLKLSCTNSQVLRYWISLVECPIVPSPTKRPFSTFSEIWMEMDTFPLRKCISKCRLQYGCHSMYTRLTILHKVRLLYWDDFFDYKIGVCRFYKSMPFKKFLSNLNVAIH